LQIRIIYARCTRTYSDYVSIIALCSVLIVSLLDAPLPDEEQMMDQESESRSKFVKLAEKRVARAIKDIRLIGNLSNRSNYSYDEEDVRKMVRALRREVRVLEERFRQGKQGEEPLFRL